MSGELRFRPAPLPADEAGRLAALQALEILDTPPEAEFDDLVSLAAELCETPIAGLSLIDQDRQWFKAGCGLPARETGRAESICAHAILGDRLLEIPDTLEDDRFADNPLVTGSPQIRFYAGFPLRGPSGHAYGSLCVIDTRPRRLTDTQRRQLERLARLAVTQLEGRRVHAESRQRALVLQTLLECMPSAVVTCDAQGRLAEFNRLARQWHGLDPDPLPATDWAGHFGLYDAAGKALLAGDQIPLLRALHGETVLDQEMVIRAEGQPPRRVLCSGAQLQMPDGRVTGAMVVMHDVTALAAARDAVERQARDLQLIIEGTDAGTWKWNARTEQLIINERWAGMLGYRIAELMPLDLAGWKRLLHPQDLGRWEALVADLLRHKASRYEFLGRLRHKDGHYVWVQSRGRVHETDEEGRALWVAGTHVDVSDLKRAEARTAEARAYLQAIVDAAADVAIVATDFEGNITFFNSGAERITGYSAEDMRRLRSPAVFHLESEVRARGEELSRLEGRPVEGFEVFVHAARQGRTETRRWTYVRKDGRLRQVRLSVGPLRLPDGTIPGYVGMAVDLTEQIEAENAAQLAAERFAGAFNSAVLGMALVGLDGRWLEVNDALCQKVGYSREALLATDAFALLHPDDREEERQRMAELAAGQIPHYMGERRYCRQNGELMWATVSAALVHDRDGKPLHFVLQIKNITEERRTKQALQASEQRLRGLFQLSPIGIGLNDGTTRRFLDANAALLAQTGYSHAELLERTCSDLSPWDSPELEQAFLEELRERGRFGPLEREYTRKDGSRYPVRLQGILVHDGSERDVIWSFIEDISEQKRIERVKSDFVSTVSHELRTPLTSISGALALINGEALGPVPEPMRDMLDIAASNTVRLTQLVNDLLDMEKLLEGKMRLDLQEIDVIPCLQQAAREMAGFAELTGVRIRCTGGRPSRAMADRQRLLQVLTNLLSNACKHSPPGGEVELHHEPSEAGGVVISVIDHGAGIPRSFRHRIFEKFAQAEAVDTRRHEGTGLGLAICMELVRKMGGVIGFESTEGEGSRFWVRLPPQGHAWRRLEPGRRPCLLHVEDDADIAELVRMQLSGIARLDHATTLAEANQRLRTQDYDLILLDLQLPDGSGEALWESLHLAQPEVPVLIMSGFEVPLAIASRVAEVLTKTELHHRLVRSVQRLLGIEEIRQ